MKRIVAVSFVALFACTSFGCSKVEKKLEEKAVEEGSSGKVQVTGSSGGYTVTTPSGTVHAQNGAGTKLPDGWPSSVPQYPGATITNSMTTPQGKMIMMQSSDPPQKVHDFYKNALKGMKLETDVDSQHVSYVMSFKEGSKIVKISIANVTTTVALEGF